MSADEFPVWEVTGGVREQSCHPRLLDGGIKSSGLTDRREIGCRFARGGGCLGGGGGGHGGAGWPRFGGLLGGVGLCRGRCRLCRLLNEGLLAVVSALEFREEHRCSRQLPGHGQQGFDVRREPEGAGQRAWMVVAGMGVNLAEV